MERKSHGRCRGFVAPLLVWRRVYFQSSNSGGRNRQVLFAGVRFRECCFERGQKSRSLHFADDAPRHGSGRDDDRRSFALVEVTAKVVRSTDNFRFVRHSGVAAIRFPQADSRYSSRRAGAWPSTLLRYAPKPFRTNHKENGLVLFLYAPSPLRCMNVLAIQAPMKCQ